LRTTILLTVILSTGTLQAQMPNVSIRTVSDYNGWGWEAAVMENGLITMATVPAIGGRVMQYDLGGNASIFVNPAEFGHTYTPANNGQWHNFGGFKTWPAPQSRWNAGGWPPPPRLDYASYSFLLDSLAQPGDSAAVFVASPSETWLTPKLRFERRATAFAGTSRIRMEQTIINDSSAAVAWSVWGVTQSIVHHTGRSDYQNFWVYFPINPNSIFGPTGVRPKGQSAAWKGEVEPGIYGVQFSPDNQLLYADPDRGWIAYANLEDTTLFAKTFQLFEGEAYPDSGARVTVYVSALNPTYFEVETKGPISSLPANGGRYTFTEDWWAARMLGPVLDVDSVGAVGERLAYDTASHLFTGRYGVFYSGTAAIAFLDRHGQAIGEGESHDVSPLEQFSLSETASIPSGTATAELRVFKGDGGFAGILDTATIADLLSEVASSPRDPVDFSLAPGFPNPFNGGTALRVTCPHAAEGSLRVYDMLGREVAVLEEGRLAAGVHSIVWNPENLASGIYVARLKTSGVQLVRKLVYLR
jgi:hypothetical protein